MKFVAEALVLLVIIFSISGCLGGDSTPALFEGDEAGECSDGADNDQDGLYDCNDPDCAGAAICTNPPTGENETTEENVQPRPVYLTNEMVLNGSLDGYECAVVVVTADWDGPSQTIKAELDSFNYSNTSDELGIFIANIQNDLGEDILPRFLEWFDERGMSVDAVPSIYFWDEDGNAALSLDGHEVPHTLCTRELREDIEAIFGNYEGNEGDNGGDEEYSRITSITVTPESPESYENPVCVAEWESNEYAENELIVFYSWNILMNETIDGSNPDDVWFSNPSIDGTFDRNNTDLGVNEATGQPWTNIVIANQSLSGKYGGCNVLLLENDVYQSLNTSDWSELSEHQLHIEWKEFSFNGTTDQEGGSSAIPNEGCCKKDSNGNFTILMWPEDGQIVESYCEYGCGWDPENNWYACLEHDGEGREGDADPSGLHPCDCSEYDSSNEDGSGGGEGE